MTHPAATALRRTIATGAESLDLDRLRRIVPFPDDASYSEILSRIDKAVACEQARGATGHWAYSTDKLIALRQAEKHVTDIIEQREIA